MRHSKIRFEDWLWSNKVEDSQMVLDDDIQDFFDSWIVEQEASQMMEWAEEWGEHLLDPNNK